jgi:hypothetical protein
MGSFLFATYILQILLWYCKYVYFNFHDLIIATGEFLLISAETACWEIERKEQIF